MGKNSLTAYRRSYLYDDLSALNGCPILREFSSPHRLQLPWKVSREQLGCKEASPGTIEVAIPSHVAYTFNVSHGASSCRVNLSGSRLRRLQFFPGSVKLRESTGRAGGLPKGNYAKYPATFAYLAKEHVGSPIWETISTSILKCFLILILSCFSAGVSGCASAYLAVRKEVMRSSYENSDLERTRSSIEKRRGKPISTVVNEDGTVTCTYEYSAATTKPAMEPLDSLAAVPKLLGGKGDSSIKILFATTALTLVESVAFTYYVVKDLALRDSVRAVVTYNQEGIVAKDYLLPVEDFTVTEAK